MRHPIFATSAVLALAGTSYGFIVTQFMIQPNQSIEPSAGAFHNYYNGEGWIAGDNLVIGNRYAWNTYATFITASSWLAIDRYGGGGEFYLVLEGLGDDPRVPEWNASNTFDIGAGPRRFDHANDIDEQFISGLDAGPDGYRIGVYPPTGESTLSATSAVSPVNAVSKDSMFWGQFVLTDPAATLVGAPLLLTIGGTDHLIPLDGSPGTNGFHTEYETFITYEGRTGLRAFIVAPAPGACTALAALACAATRRRR